MRNAIRAFAALAVLGAVAAGAVVGLGLYNVSARQAHYPGVSWLLHSTYRNSVRLRAPDTSEIPRDLNSPDRIALGALHFQTACAFCHALPGQTRSATALAMEPTPPQIETAVAPWEPQHLFWIVREGVKMSGMPHWPGEAREDEVWSVVAYLDAVARGAAPVLTGETTCAACHGDTGQGGNTHVPRLDILSPDYIAAALRQYRSGARASGFMAEAARRLSDGQIEELAKEFGGDRRPAPVPAPFDLAQKGSDDVPACTACHGPGRTAKAPIAPSLAGQSRAYLETQLYLWRDGNRGGGTRADLMTKAARDLSDDEIAALAGWFAGLSAGSAEPRPDR